jgi:hypothetical protein
MGTYTATVTINGGTPPYSVDGTQVGSTFTTSPIKSGTAGSIIVTDSKQCTARADFTRNCLPCAGIAQRRGFLFFLPDSSKVTTYANLGFENATFLLDSPQGTTLNLSVEVTSLLQKMVTAASLSDSFQTTMSKWVAQVNALVAGRTQTNWMKLAYTPRQPGALGMLSIEYFECLKFDIRFAATFELKTSPGVKHRFALAYSPAGTAVSGDASIKLLPPFDPVRVDKSGAQTQETPLCSSPFPELTLKVPSTTGLSVKPSATATKPAGMLWEAMDAKPPLSLTTGLSATFTFTTPGQKLVAVTAFTKDGCSKRVVQTVNVGPSPVG